VTLTASAASGSTFTGWGGACTGTGSACTVTAGAVGLVVATFRAAPTYETTFYHLDVLGSVRALTNASGATVERHDYWAFGETGDALSADATRFAGKGRDPESLLSYSGARYYMDRTGRFGSTDPVSADLLRMVEPQRWNKYSYALVNPLRFQDPDGRDVVLVDVIGAARGFGHLAVVVIDSTGRATLGEFTQINIGSVTGPGLFNIDDLPHNMNRASLDQLRGDIAADLHRAAANIRITYIVTSTAATQAMRQVLDHWKSLRNSGQTPRYVVGFFDCVTNAEDVLAVGGMDRPPDGGNPLMKAGFHLPLAAGAWYAFMYGSTLQGHVTTSYTIDYSSLNTFTLR
jgi:RHS repeat-associated protein